MERISDEKLKDIFPAQDDKDLKFNKDEQEVLLKMLDALESYAENELELARKAERHWLIDYQGSVSEAKSNLKEIRKWVNYFKDKLR